MCVKAKCNRIYCEALSREANVSMFSPCDADPDPPSISAFQAVIRLQSVQCDYFLTLMDFRCILSVE